MNEINRTLSMAIRSNKRIEYIVSDSIAPDGIVIITPSEIRKEWMILIPPNRLDEFLEMIPQARSATVASV